MLMPRNHLVLVLGFATILLTTSCNKEEEIQISEGDQVRNNELPFLLILD
jgi:hypothetical protein